MQNFWHRRIAHQNTNIAIKQTLKRYLDQLKGNNLLLTFYS